MADLATREEWEREYDLLAQDGTLTNALADARRPNSAEPHDADAHVERARQFAPTIISVLLKASARITSPRVQK